MANVLHESDSTLTSRYQTTVPEAVRRALKLKKGDKVHYSIQPDGKVLLSRRELFSEEDPVCSKFLAFLTKDMMAHPEQLQVANKTFVKRLKTLVGKTKFDLNSPLSKDDE